MLVPPLLKGMAAMAAVSWAGCPLKAPRSQRSWPAPLNSTTPTCVRLGPVSTV